MCESVTLHIFIFLRYLNRYTTTYLSEQTPGALDMFLAQIETIGIKTMRYHPPPPINKRVHGFYKQLHTYIYIYIHTYVYTQVMSKCNTTNAVEPYRQNIFHFKYTWTSCILRVERNILCVCFIFYVSGLAKYSMCKQKKKYCTCKQRIDILCASR